MSANGRVNILEPVTSNVFNLYDRVPVDQKATSFRNALIWFCPNCKRYGNWVGL